MRAYPRWWGRTVRACTTPCWGQQRTSPHPSTCLISLQLTPSGGTPMVWAEMSSRPFFPHTVLLCDGPASSLSWWFIFWDPVDFFCPHLLSGLFVCVSPRWWNLWLEYGLWRGLGDGVLVCCFHSQNVLDILFPPSPWFCAFFDSLGWWCCIYFGFTKVMVLFAYLWFT